MAEQARAQRARRRRSRRRRQVAAAAAGIIVVGGGSAVAIATTSSDWPEYRVAAVTRASVTQTISSSGTVTSSSTLSLSFPTNGTVRSVRVKLGQSVKRGQVLAMLDMTSLQSAVVSAQSTVASAEQRLEADKSGQTSPTRAGQSNSGQSTSGQSNAGGVATSSFSESPLPGPSTSPTSPAPTSSTSRMKQPPQPGTARNSLPDLVKRVQQAQDAVVVAQKDVDANQTAVDAAQQRVDTDVTTNTSLARAQDTACTTDPSSTDCASARSVYETNAATLEGDKQALDTAIEAQDGAIKALDTAITDLNELVDQLQIAANSTASNAGSTGETHNGSTQPDTSKASGTRGKRPGTGTSGGTRTVHSDRPSGAANTGTSKQEFPQQQTAQPASAAQLASDQAAIDAAQAQLRVTKQNLAAATLKSPSAGKVAEVDMAAGSSSHGATITIVGTGIQGIEMSVPLAQIDTIKVGQPAVISADGVRQELHGTVESVGLLSSSSGSSTTFPVLVRLAAGSPPLYDGSGAEVVVTARTVHNALTVPISAVHIIGNGRDTVTVVDGTKASVVPITAGVSGRDRIQVLSGLKLGQQVLLADLSQKLPSSATADTTTPRLRGVLSGGGRFRSFSRPGN